MNALANSLALEAQMEEGLNTRQAASFLGLRPGTLAWWRMESRGPAYVKLGKRVVYHIDALRRFQTSHTIDPERGQNPQHAA